MTLVDIVVDWLEMKTYQTVIFFKLNFGGRGVCGLVRKDMSGKQRWNEQKLSGF